MTEIVKDEQKRYNVDGCFLSHCVCDTCPETMLEKTHTDDIGSEYYKCPSCGKTFQLPFTEERKDQEIIKLKLEEELPLAVLDQVLSKTIFEDYPTKIILFLVALLTYTSDVQENIILTGESGIGKTYGLNEILWFFDDGSRNGDGDILRFEGATPKSFIHRSEAKEIDARRLPEIIEIVKPEREDMEADKEFQDRLNNWYDQRRHAVFYLDYAKKIVVFPDMPDSKLLKSIRPLLSHDRKICAYEVTEKGNKGLRTKEVLIKGYFTSIFASASTELDEQESSRHFLLSPTDDVKKIHRALDLISRKSSDPDFKVWYETDIDRKALKSRVQDIKRAKIDTILIPEDAINDLQQWFLARISNICPKTQRDFPRLIALAKAWALLNYKKRRQEEVNHERIYEKTNILWCTQEDVNMAKNLYEPILACNELGLSPEEYGVWNVIKAQCESTSVGLSIKDIHGLYYINKKRACSDRRLRGMLVNFCRASLLREDKEGKKLMYFPIVRETEAQSSLIGKVEVKLPKNKINMAVEILKLIPPRTPTTINQIFEMVKDNKLQIKRDELDQIIEDLYKNNKIMKNNEGCGEEINVTRLE